MAADIREWLEGLGLDKYAEAFTENDVDLDVLPNLTEQDLKDLGLSLGHRRKALAAIGVLVASSEAISRVETAADTTGPSPPARPDAERRQLTVLFCDLVGSTELSRRLDPEDLRELMRSYQNAVSRAVARYDGHVGKFLGDGVLAIFGWPRAYEDQAERAVRAGLDAVASVEKLDLDGKEALSTRIGIATGQVVVGDIVGEGGREADAVTGETPNLAARLQGAAEPGQVLIGATTRRLVGATFELRDLGKQDLKGFGAVPAWCVLGERAVRSRFEASHGDELTRFVGRQHELGMLLERWDLARSGEGQVLLLSGEPGIGKSRLVETLEECTASHPRVRLRYQCSPYHINSALYPISQQLMRAAGFKIDDTDDVRLDKLAALLQPGPSVDAEIVPLVAGLLSVPYVTRYGEFDLTPQQRKDRALEALVEELLRLTRQQPLLVIFEDAHWIDPTSNELLERTIPRLIDAPVLMLITHRPEWHANFSNEPHVGALALSRFGRAQVTEMIMTLAGDALDNVLLSQIVARTDGIPLFVEEVTKAVLEASGGATDDASKVPDSLLASLLARLDRLGEAKEIAQIGAVAGREFSYELLAAVADRPTSELDTALNRLVSSQLVFQKGTPPDAVYTFKHALIQDAAYQSLLKAKRQTLHSTIALVLEERLPRVVEGQPELLAHHFTEAGSVEQAVRYWQIAGERASRGSANVEAIAYLSNGLDLLGELPSEYRRAEIELALQLVIAVPYLATKGYSAAEVLRAYSRAAALYEGLGRPQERFPVLRGLWNCHLVRGELIKAYEFARQVFALAEERGEPLPRALSRRALGSSLFFLGRFQEAQEQLIEGIALDDQVQETAHQASLPLYAERAGVVCRSYAGWCQWYLGYPDQALRTVEAGVALARELGHAHSVAHALTTAALVQNCRGEFAAAIEQSDIAINAADEQGLPQWRAKAKMHRGFALASLGEHAEGIENIDSGLAEWHRIGARLLDSQWFGDLAAAHAQAGQFDQSLAALDQAAKTVGDTGEAYYQSEICRLRGEILATTGSVEKGEVWLIKALDLARDQNSKSLELRAAISLAHLWRDQRKRAKAGELLAPVYAWFTEGFDTQDLKEAKALLDEMA